MEDFPWPQKLTAHIVDDDGETTRLQGYALSEDLVQHYSFTEMAYLALTGNLPSERQSLLLELALRLWAPISVAEAPAHAAALARICGSSTSATIGIAATVLAEQSQDLIRRHKAWIKSLITGLGHDPSASPPPHRQQKILADLAPLLDAAGIKVPLLEQAQSAEALVLALLVAAGLQQSTQLASILVMARLPVACAEAWPRKGASFAKYPSTLPPFVFQETK